MFLFNPLIILFLSEYFLYYIEIKKKNLILISISYFYSLNYYNYIISNLYLIIFINKSYLWRLIKIFLVIFLLYFYNNYMLLISFIFDILVE